MSLFPNFRSWFLANVDTGQILQGQFEPLDAQKTIKANYGHHTALSRNKGILQFLTGDNDTFTFQAFMYSQHAAQSIDADLATLESWTRPDSKLGRPPTLSFWVGDGHVQIIDCVIESLSTSYGRPTFLGGLRQAQVNISLREYKPFSLTDTGVYETRYHRTAARDYYELICQREYNDPMMGDVIRKRHPTKPTLYVGAVVKLPSIEAIRTEVVTQTSIALAGAYSKKNTPQRQLRLEMFEKRNRSYVSHVLVGT